MEINELQPQLRVGNLLQDRKGRLCKVKEVGIGTVYAPAILGPSTSLPNEPIEITNEWLLKLGFSFPDSEYEGEIIVKKESRFSAIKAKGFYSIGLAGPFGLYLVKVKYVHHLQNLYHSLFGEDLQIKN